MRGRPILELLLLLAVWGCLFLPLRAVTRSHERREAALPAADEAQRVPVWIELLFTEAPEGFRLYSHDDLVWDASDPVAEQEQPLDLMWDAQSQGDLILEATWEDARRRATEVRVSPPEGRSLSVTLWHDADTIEELLLFP